MSGNWNLIWSGLIAVVFLIMGIQVAMGKTEFLGKGTEKDIKPELKAAYCREMCIPIFILSAVEVADVILQLTVANFANWSLLILGAGILICLGWITMIQRKYSKM